MNTRTCLRFVSRCPGRRSFVRRKAHRTVTSSSSSFATPASYIFRSSYVCRESQRGVDTAKVRVAALEHRAFSDAGRSRWRLLVDARPRRWTIAVISEVRHIEIFKERSGRARVGEVELHRYRVGVWHCRRTEAVTKCAQHRLDAQALQLAP